MSGAPTVALPCLQHLALSFFHNADVSPPGLAQLLGLLDGSPFTSVALSLPPDVDQLRYVCQLASLPRLTSLQLDEAAPTAPSNPMFATSARSRLVKMIDRYCHPMTVSSEQLHVAMQYYWQDGLPGEDEDELRAKYACGVKLSRESWAYHDRWWRVFNKARREAGEDGRAAFFRSLVEEGDEEKATEPFVCQSILACPPSTPC